MIFDIRWIPVLFINCILIFLFQILNDWLSPASIYLYLCSVLLIFPAYHLEMKGGYFCAVMTALAYDAIHVIDFGTSLFPFLLVFSFIYATRDRIHPNSKTHAIVLNIFINAIMIIVMSFILGSGSLLSLSYWGRVFMDIIFATIAMLLVSPITQILQRNTLLLCGFTLHYDKKLI